MNLHLIIYLLSTYYMLNTLLGILDIIVGRTDNDPALSVTLVSTGWMPGHAWWNSRHILGIKSGRNVKTLRITCYPGGAHSEACISLLFKSRKYTYMCNRIDRKALSVSYNQAWCSIQEVWKLLSLWLCRNQLFC